MALKSSVGIFKELGYSLKYGTVINFTIFNIATMISLSHYPYFNIFN